jgi:hypothetical protein
MKIFQPALYLILGMSILSITNVSAQETSDAKSDAESAEAATVKADEPKPAGKKMVAEASISLRTTVTGNQEQPLVMYILPWQSPDSPEFDLEMQSSQADAVFGHIEREELNRQLDSAGELDEAN